MLVGPVGDPAQSTVTTVRNKIAKKQRMCVSACTPLRRFIPDFLHARFFADNQTKNVHANALSV